MTICIIHVSDAGYIRTWCDSEEFVTANAEDDEICSAVLSLKPGESFHVGGGAAPKFIIRRPVLTLNRKVQS